MKKIIMLMLAVMLAFSFTGCKGKDDLSKYDKFTYEDLTFYLPKDLNAKKTDVDGYEYAVGNDDFLVFINHLALADAKANNIDIDQLKATVFEGETPFKVGNWDTIKYDKTVGSTDYHYTYSWVQTNTNIFDFNCICFKNEESKYDKIMEDIITKIQVGK